MFYKHCFGVDVGKHSHITAGNVNQHNLSAEQSGTVFNN